MEMAVKKVQKSNSMCGGRLNSGRATTRINPKISTKKRFQDSGFPYIL
jgi:hypothetical protein